MQPTPNNPSRKNESPKGFALIATLVIMVLLTMITLALITTATVESRFSVNAAEHATAKANARLALQIALSELQTHAGADQRVTATASILDEDPTTQIIDNVEQPHWTGVWKTTDDSNQPLIYRNDIGDPSIGAAGLLDSRFTSGTNWSINQKQDNNLSWLISKPTNISKLDPRTLPSTIPTVTLVSSRGDHPSVNAPKVSILNKGAYAWWVGDEGVKAHLSIENPYAEKTPDNANPNADDFSWLTSIPALQTEAIDPTWAPIQTNASKILTRDTLTLPAPTANKTYFHDYTTYSQGLLTDSLRGGLRKNLSAYLLDGQQPPLSGHSAGLNDQSRLTGPLDETDAQQQNLAWNDTKHRNMSGRFGLLRSWTNFGKQHWNNPSTALPFTLPITAGINDDGKLNTIQFDLTKQTQANLKPVLCEGAVYYNYTMYDTGDPTLGKQIRTHVYPRVVMWNPYNTKLSVPGMIVYLRVMGQRLIELRPRAGGTAPNPVERHSVLPDLYNGRHGDNGTFRGSLVFYLEPTVYEAGECLVFSHAQGGSTEYKQDEIEKNRLSAKSAPLNSNFYINRTDNHGVIWPWLELGASRDLEFKFNSGGSVEDLALTLKAPPNGASSSFPITRLDAMNKWVTIQNINYHYAGGDATNPDPGAGWNSTSWQPIEEFAIAKNDPPNFKTRDGARLRWIRETPENLTFAGANAGLHKTAPIVAYNFHNNITLRTPKDNVSPRIGTSNNFLEPSIFGDFVRDVWGQQASWQNTEPVPLSDGKFGGNPFACPQDWFEEKYILFDLPNPDQIGLTSLPQLQSAPVSAYSWHTSYVIGNSWAEPRAPATGTAPLWSSEGGWNASLLESASRSQQFRDLLQLDVFNLNPGREKQLNDQLVYDISYEINHQLFDRYFLSGNNTTETTNFINTPTNRNLLKNARLRSIAPATLETTNGDFHHAAKNLLTIGAFNVNSTSVDAWKALLLATRNKAPDADPKAKDRAAFPRFPITPSGPADDQQPDSSGSAWSGYRSLSDNEITPLAQNIVAEVKTRGPFISLSDFVNRRLTTDSTGLIGALQAAINTSNLNDNQNQGYELNSSPMIGATFRMREEAKPIHHTAGMPSYLQQSDILQPIAPVLSARSDTFTIRAYGEATNAAGEIKAKAWCEAIVQRTPTPITPDAQNLDPVKPTSTENPDYGRRFEIISFRWLNPDEI